MNRTASAPEKAFEYRVRVQPHHTDYAGVVWHGTYVAWLEEARVEYLRSRGINFADWVNSGVDLPVVDLSLQYRRSLAMGMTALIKCWVQPPKGVRIFWHYDIQDQATGDTCVLGKVTLVPVDHKRRKILRQLPAAVQADMARVYV
ncbi:MAG: thioesterase family protein [Cyanobacteria bacterium P01_H01_bin.162]